MVSAPIVVIGFSGAATIRQADDVAERLRRSLADSERIEIDCGELAEVDLSFVQLVLAARKSALAAGKSLTLSAPARGALRDALLACGIDHGPCAQFWLEGRTP